MTFGSLSKLAPMQLDTNFFTNFSLDVVSRLSLPVSRNSATRLSHKCPSHQVKYSDSNEDQQFVRGMPIHPVSEVLPALINGPGPATSSLPRQIQGCGVPILRTLGVEMSRTLLSQARSFGLSEDWVKKLLEKDPVRRQVRICSSLVSLCFTVSWCLV